MTAKIVTTEIADLVTSARRPAPCQQLVRYRGKREHVGRCAPLGASDTLGRTVRTPDGRSHPDAFQCFDDAEAARAGLVRGDEDVTEMEGTVPNASGSGEVNGTSQLRQEWQRTIERRRRVVPHRDVERLGRYIFLGPIGACAFNPGRNRLDDRWVEESRVCGARQLVSERLCLLRCHVEAEYLDGHETIARRLVGTKDGTKSSNANLMQDAERSKRGRWSEGSRIVSGHSGEGRKNVAQIVPRLKRMAGSTA
jgi:hypothetical protein